MTVFPDVKCSPLLWENKHYKSLKTKYTGNYLNLRELK